MLIVDEKKVVAVVGGLVTLHGGVFSPSSVIYDDETEIIPVDVDDGYIVFPAPSSLGTHEITVYDGDVYSESVILDVREQNKINNYSLPERIVSDYENAILELMPRGIISDYSKGTNWRKMIDAIAASFLYVYIVVDLLVKESSPYTTGDLGIFESEYGLPKKGIMQSTSEGRRKEVVRISRMSAGVSVPYIKSIIDLYGVEYEIYEYWKNPGKFPAWVSSLTLKERYFSFVVIIYRDESEYGFTCNSKCSDSLGFKRNRILEQGVKSELQAHVRPIFYYKRRNTDA